MAIALLVNVLSLLFGYLLMFGAGGFQGLGIRGMGMAMSIARTIGGLVILAILLSGRAKIHVPRVGLFRWNGPMLRRVLRIGIPASLEQVALMGGNLMVQIVIALMPTSDMAAHQVLMCTCQRSPQHDSGTRDGDDNAGRAVSRGGPGDLAQRGTLQAVALGGISNLLSYLIFIFSSLCHRFFQAILPSWPPSFV